MTKSERDKLRAMLDAMSLPRYHEWFRDGLRVVLDDADALDAAEARAAQSAAQVRVLAGELAARVAICPKRQPCPEDNDGCPGCPFCLPDADAWAAWSAREAGVSHE